MPEINPRYNENLRLLNDPRVQSLLKTIRSAEGATYNTRVGGSTFDDLSKKPGVVTKLPKLGISSSAEGAYQYLNKTWNGISKDLGIKDFSPLSQDVGAVELIRRRGALDNLLRGDFKGSINKLSPEWASLPTESGKGYYSGQKARRIDDLEKIYSGQEVPRGTYESFISPTYSHSKQIDLESSPVDLESSTAEYIEPEVEEAKQDIAQKSFQEDFSKLMSTQQSQEPVQPTQQIQDFVPSDLPDPYNYIQTDPGYNFANGGEVDPPLKDFRKKEDIIRVPNSLSPIPDIDNSGYVRTTSIPHDIKLGNDFEKNAYRQFDNWYSNPVTQDRFEKNTGFDESRLQDFIGKGLRTPLLEAKLPQDIERLNNADADAEYRAANRLKYFGTERNQNTGEIVYNTQGIDPNMLTNKIGHELGHASNLDAVLGRPLLRVLGDPTKQIKNAPGSVKDYLSHPEESYGNFHEFRLNLGLKPGQKVNEEQLKQLVKDKKLQNENFYQTYDDDKIVKAINTIASNDTNTGNYYAQEGGKIIKDDNGYWNPDNWGHTVEISSPNITMQGVNQHLIGISKETGQQMLMSPGEDYYFPNTKSVIEVPIKNNKSKNRFK